LISGPVRATSALPWHSSSRAENVQRADLGPVEEALGYQLLMDDHGYTQADLAQVIGKSRSHVANTLRLLKLPAEVQHLLNEGKISAGHARCLILADHPLELAQRIIDEGLSVRQAEMLAPRLNERSTQDAAAFPLSGREGKDADTRALERRLNDILGLRVDIKFGAQGGAIRISYKTLDQLESICRRLEQA